MMIQHIRFAVSCALLAAAAAAQAPAWVTKAPGRETWPKLEAVILRHHVDITLHADKRVTRRVLIATKVLRQPPYNRQGLADPRIPFDSAYQAVKVLKARVWTPAGRAMDTAANGFNIVYPDALVQAPDHATCRDLVITHVGIEEGCVTVLEYEITEKAPGPWPYDGAASAQLVFPIREQRITVKAPQGCPLQATLLEAVKHSGVESSYACPDGTTYTFSRRGMIPAAATPADQVVYTTMKRQEMEKRVGQTGPAGPLPQPLVKKLASIRNHPGDRLAKADKVADLLKKGLRLQAVPRIGIRWRLRSGARIWRSTYATPFEMAGLLRSSLLEAGFPTAAVVPVANRSGLDLPCLSAADTLWVRAGAPGIGACWIQVGARPGAPAPTALLGKSLALGPQYQGPGKRIVALQGHLRVGAKGCIKGDLELLLAGAGLNHPLARLQGLDPQVAAQVARCGGAKPVKTEVTGLNAEKASAKVAFSGGSCHKDGAGYLHLLLPLPAGSPALVVPGLHRATSPGVVNLGAAAGVEEVDLAINLPPGLKLVGTPAPMEVANPLGSLRLVVRPMGPAMVRFTYRLEVKKGLITPELWPQLRALLAPLANPTTLTLLLAQS